MTRTSEFERHYQFYGEKYSCAYCDAPADTIDHTTPVWFVDGNPELVRRFNFIKVSACRECNGFASSIIDNTWAERKQRIAAKLRKKYYKILIDVQWSKEELDELGPNLRHHVKKLNKANDTLHRRLAVLEDYFWPSGMPQVLQISKDNVLNN